MTNTNHKNFIVRDSKNNVVYKGIGGDANAWAARNVHKFGDLFVHYPNGINVLHWFIGPVATIWGNVSNEVQQEWVA